jgi:uncharacterized protein YutE (UPF0331/DUF86 family)
MAGLDKDKILRYEAEIKEAQNVLLEITSHDVNEFVQNSMMIGAMKYNLIILVEAICNICRHILAKKEHTVVEEYGEALSKMKEKGFLSEAMTGQLIPLTKLRHQLIHGYWKTDDRRLFIETKEGLKTIDAFLPEINHFASSA